MGFGEVHNPLCKDASLTWERKETPKKQIHYLVDIREDVNGEKLTVKKMVDFWCPFFTVYAELFTVYKGHKR